MRFDKGMLVRGISSAAVMAALALLAACGSSGNSITGNGGVTIGLTRTTPFVDPGQSATITAVTSSGGVNWSLSPSAFGTLSGQTSTGVTYTAPASVTTATAVTITATSTTSTSVVAPIQIEVRTSPVIALSTVGPQTINQGHQLSVNATLTGDTTNMGVTWSLSSGVGTLSNQTTTSVTYTAPGAVSGNTPVTLTATSKANTGSTASIELTVFSSGAAANVAALSTAGGPVAPSTNSLYTSVTICSPLSPADCQTIDNILVDTGSEGLRVLQSLVEPLVLPAITDGSGGEIDNCVSFLDGSYLWGPVELANIRIGGEATSNTPIQVITSGSVTVPTNCSGGGTVNENTPQLLGANGILGIGLEPTDCFLQGSNFCDGSLGSVATAYFDCPRSGCDVSAAPAAVTALNQVTNPVVAIGADSNGTAIQLPALASTSPEVDGSLIFGIGTASNNALGAATPFGLDANDNFITLFNSQNLSGSFIDSGSNGLFFPSTITACSSSTSGGFYCPATVQPLTATQEDAGGNNATVVNFSVDNADNLFSSNTDTAFSTLGGPLTCSGSGCAFDWGMPFFYGRTVFTAIDGASTPIGSGPFWAY